MVARSQIRPWPAPVAVGQQAAARLGGLLRAGRRAASLCLCALDAVGRAGVGARSFDRIPSRRVRAQAALLARKSAELLAAHGIELRVLGAVPPGPAVLVANHLSYLDPIVLLSVFPALPIAKLEVASWPLIGSATQRLGVLFVERNQAWSGARVLRAALRALRCGVSVLNFPEGTTASGGQLGTFRRGSFGLARLAGLPVVPAALRYDRCDLTWSGDALFLPHYLRTAAREHVEVDVHFGPPLDSRRYSSAEELAKAARSSVVRLQRSLEP